MKWKRPTLQFMKRFWSKYNHDDITTLAASVAFYTAFSLAPLLILFAEAASYMGPNLRPQLLTQVRGLLGSESAAVIEMILANTQPQPHLISGGNLTGLVVLLSSASLIFGALRTTFDRIFAIPQEDDSRETYVELTWEYIKGRLLQIVLVLAFVISLAATAAIASVFSILLPSTRIALSEILLSFVFFAGVFTLIYRFFPSRRLPWRDAWRAALITSVMFAVGKQVLTLYLGHSGVGTAYGAAGSIVVFLLWVYFSSLITFVGAEISVALGKKSAA